MSATIRNCIMGPISPEGRAYLVETIGGEVKREELSQLCSVVVWANDRACMCNSTAMLHLPLAEKLKPPNLTDLKLEAEKQKLAFVAAEDGIAVEFEKLRKQMVGASMGVMALELKRCLDNFHRSLNEFAHQRPTVHPIPEPARPDVNSIIHEIRKAEIALAEKQRRRPDNLETTEKRAKRTKKPKAAKIVVSSDGSTVSVGGIKHRLQGSRDGKFIRTLQESAGQAVKATTLESSLGERPARIFKRLPKAIRDAISKPGRGQTGYILNT